MDQDSRRSLHQLIMRALDKDTLATAAMGEMIVGLDRSESADDVAQALQMLATVGGDELYKSIVTLLQENDEYRSRRNGPSPLTLSSSSLAGKNFQRDGAHAATAAVINGVIPRRLH
jgi:hypothetical protein